MTIQRTKGGVICDTLQSHSGVPVHEFLENYFVGYGKVYTKDGKLLSPDFKFVCNEVYWLPTESFYASPRSPTLVNS